MEDIFFGLVDAWPEPTYVEKMRVPHLGKYDDVR